MLVVSLDALVCGLKLPRALRGFVQHAAAAGRLGLADSWCLLRSWLAARASIVLASLFWCGNRTIVNAQNGAS